MRIAGWQQALADEISASAARRFRWGSFDCCHFAARCYELVTGEDVLHKFAPYANKAGALKILEELGGMRNLLIRACGAPKPVAFAGQGDVVLIDMGRGPQPAVCMGLNSWAPTRRGLTYRPTLQGVEAWTV